MSLVPYSNDSLILKDSNSKSLMIVNPSLDKLSYFKQIVPPRENKKFSHTFQKKGDKIPEEESRSSFICPQCGTEINSVPQRKRLKYSQNSRYTKDSSSFNLSKRYFRLLQDTYTQQQLISDSVNDFKFSSYIPNDLFIPGYFHKFFTTLSLLGSGARGSVLKVVHRIGDTNLGVFALKKISIGNDMIWFNKCIREVKALSSITHKSVNLITYNHVWLEMDSSYGVTGTVTHKEKIPCLFILQQYCEGGNLEDCILTDVFKKFPERISKEERKRMFREKRNQQNRDISQLGLSTIQILSIIRDIARGLHELHDIGIIHRDLKPSNILLLNKYSEPRSSPYDIDNPTNGQIGDCFPTVVIGDLGESQLAGESRTGTGYTGTLEFTAPEVIITNLSNDYQETSCNEYTFASDMYSLGMICYFIVFGELPFDPQLEISDMRQSVKKFKGNKKNMIELHQQKDLKPINDQIFELIESLLSTEIKSRPEAKQVENILNHIILEQEDDKNFHLDRRTSITPLEEENYDIEVLVEDSINNPDELSIDENKLALTNSSGLVDIPSDEELEIYTKYNSKNLKNADNAFGYIFWMRYFLESSIYTLLLLPLSLIILTSSSNGSTVNYFTIFLLGMSFGCSKQISRVIGMILSIILIVRLGNTYFDCNY